MVSNNCWNSQNPAQTARGGTGLPSITNHAVMIGAGSNPVNTVGPLTNGQLLIGSTGNDPVAASLIAGPNITLTPGPGSLTIGATALSGKLAQVVSATTGTFADVTATFPHDNTIPQNTEGAEILNVSITPTNVNSKLVIWGLAQGVSFFSGTFGAMMACLFQDSTANALAVAGANSNNGMWASVPILHTLTANTTSPTTFRMRVGLESTAGSPHFYANGNSSGQLYGGASLCYLIVAEITP